MRYNLITLDLFLCASKYKSLVKAAKEKNLVVSAVSKRILDLEKSVGVNLFYRKKTGVELTPAGLEMQKHCTEIFNSIKSRILFLSIDFNLDVNYIFQFCTHI